MFFYIRYLYINKIVVYLPKIRTMNEQLKNVFSPIRIIYAEKSMLELNEVVTKTNCRRILESVGYSLKSYVLTNYGTTIINYDTKTDSQN